MATMNDAELDNLCLWLTGQVYIYYPDTNNFYKDAYQTGCRPQELLEINRWTYLTATDIRLTPLKGNGLRYFNADILTPNFVTAIVNQIKPYDGLTLRQISSVTKKLTPAYFLGTENKSAIDYIFRYNKIKKLHNEGMSDANIQAYFGWSSPTLPALYYSKELFYEGTLPPSQGAYLADSFGNLLIDFNSDKITY